MTREQYIKSTMELNVFFSRIFKEHCVTIAAGQRNGDMRVLQSLDRYKVHFEMLLSSALENGLNLIDPRLIELNCFITPYTYNCEQMTQSSCGISINHRISSFEIEKLNKPAPIAAGRLPYAYERALRLNTDGEEIARGLEELLTNILKEVKSGRMYSSVYPSVYECYILELNRYQKAIDMLRTDQKFFYFDEGAAKIMQTNAEHIRGMLDPCEMDDINKANYFAALFSECNKDNDQKFIEINEKFAEFLQDLIEKMLAKKLSSVMLPLTLDNILRQANRNIGLKLSD
ncbi:MAG TPA: DUF2935 domain-containing protein [Clostridia bacterium]